MNSAELSRSSDLVAVWDVPLYDGNHKIEFEHGTTTGRRVIRVDNEVCNFLKCNFIAQ